MRASVNFGTAQTGVGYQFFDETGLIGTKVTSGIVTITDGVYFIDVTPPETAAGVYWSCDDTTLEAIEPVPGLAPGKFVVNFGAAQTGVAYQFFNGAGLVGSQVSAGVVQVVNGVYIVNVSVPTGATNILWTCDAGLNAVDSIETFEQPVDNLTVIASYLAAIKARTDLIPNAPAAVPDIPSSAAIAQSVVNRTVVGSQTVGDLLTVLNTGVPLSVPVALEVVQTEGPLSIGMTQSIKWGDTEPDIPFLLGAGGIPTDLTGKTATARISRANQTWSRDIVLNVLNPPTSGLAALSLAALNYSDFVPATYRVEVHVGEGATGRTYPTKDYATLVIKPRLPAPV